MRKDPIGLATHGAKPAGGQRLVQGEGQCWHEGVLALANPDTAGRGFTVPGRSLAGDRTQTRESRMAAIAVSFMILDRCFDIREGYSRSATIRVGPGVQPLQGVKLYV